LRGIRDAVPAGAVTRQRWHVHAIWVAACVLAVVAAVLATRAFRAPVRGNGPTIRASMLPPPHAAFSSIGTLAGGGASMAASQGGTIGSFAISPDGTGITFTALDSGGKTLLWIRRLDGFAT